MSTETNCQKHVARRSEWKRALPNGPSPVSRAAGQRFETMNVTVPIKLIVDSWIHPSPVERAALSGGDFHGGSTFDATIQVPIDEVETLISAAVVKAELRCVVRLATETPV